MKHYDYSYLPVLVAEQGRLFREVSSKGYDIRKFIPDFMCSRLRHGMDVCSARAVTQTAEEMLESLKIDEGIIPKWGSKSTNIFRDEWVGSIYCYIQWLVSWNSKDLLMTIPFDKLYDWYNRLVNKSIEESSYILIQQFNIASDELKRTKEYRKYASNM